MILEIQGAVSDCGSPLQLPDWNIEHIAICSKGESYAEQGSGEWGDCQWCEPFAWANSSTQGTKLPLQWVSISSCHLD